MMRGQSRRALVRQAGSFIVLCIALAGQGKVAAGAPAAGPAAAPDALTAILSEPVVSSDVILEEVRHFCETRVPAVPQAKSAQEWQQIASRLRREMIEKVVLRGEAARWNDAPAKVEWLDTIPSTGPADAKAGYSIRKLRFEALPGMWIPALLYVPDKLEGRRPVSLAVNGHESVGKSIAYKQIRCINQAKRGIIVLNIEFFGMGQLGSDSYLHYCANQLDLCGTSAVSPFYLCMKRGLDILLSLPNADPQRVAVSGLSGGGWQTIFISGLDERVTLANPVAGYSSFLTRARNPSDLGDTEQTPCDMATVLDYKHLTAMRAPRPTLLTFNSKDNCCFASGHALQPLVDASRPIFALYGQEANLCWHVNDVPGTHNYEQENREEFYKMLGTHFYAGQDFDWHEIPCADEVKTAEQFNVPLPEKNESFNSLARKLMADLPRSIRPRDAGAGSASTTEAERRAVLRDVVHLKDYEVIAERKSSGPRQLADANDSLQVTAWQLKFGKDWTVPAMELSRNANKGTTILIADEGRKSAVEPIKGLLASGQRVIAVDPFYFGESTIPERDALYALLMAGVGERPIGVQAGQVAAIARWARTSAGQGPVSLAAFGERTSTIALIAAALETEAIGSVEVHGALPSLKLLIERNQRVDHMPELFCFGLLEQFDIKEIAALIAPRAVRGL
jgi:hypothetical protein